MFNRVLKMALDSAEWAIPEKIQTAEVEDILSEKKTLEFLDLSLNP